MLFQADGFAETVVCSLTFMAGAGSMVIVETFSKWEGSG